MRRLLAVSLLRVLAALWIGCASNVSEPARLRVEIFSGFAAPPAARSTASERVDVLLDFTPSMQAATSGGPSRAEAARSAAARLVHSLPEGRTLALHALGVADVEDACQPAFRVEQVAAGEPRGALFAQIASFEPRGEGSLAHAVDGLRVHLGVRKELTGARVVILSDLDDACGGDLCAPVEGLVAGGARVDIVVLGDRPVPECLAAFSPEIVWGGEDAEGALAPAFRVEAGGENPTPDTLPLAMGRAGAGDVAVPAGRAYVTVALGESVRVGPIDLVAGETTQLRILDFPAADPPAREWFWGVLPGPSLDADAEDDEP